MSRVTKFRAWEKNMKETIPVYDINFEFKMINTQTAWRLFDEIELMQYTGLTDKNSVPIYEGDIVKCISFDQQTISAGTVLFQGCDYVVKFTEGSSRGFYYLHHILIDSIEVIGNIHSTPHLLSDTHSP